MTLNLLPIGLSLSADAFETKSKQRSDGTISAAPSFDPTTDEDTRKRILERDDHTCQYCGFHSKKFQLIHVIDQKKPKTSDDNLATSCIFCNQCFSIDKISDMKSGTLIWMPELTQAQVHHLARSIYVARITQGPMAEVARNTLEMVMKRREEAIERIKTDDPKILSLVMTDYMTKGQYQNSLSKLDGIRVFPLDRRTIKEGELEFNQFPQILAYWRSKDGPFASINPNDWLDHYIDLKAA